MILKKATEKIKQNKTKRGSYIVEAALTLPVLFVAILCLSSLIQIISLCESIGHVAATGLKEASFNENRLFNTVSLCNEIENGLEAECGELECFQIEQIRWLYEEDGIYDLICIKTKSDFSVAHTIGINGSIAFSLQLKARGFTGAQVDGNPLELSAFTDYGEAVDVVIFPTFGERFHLNTCSIVKREGKDGNKGQIVDREEALRMGFLACKLCGGGT